MKVLVSLVMLFSLQNLWALEIPQVTPKLPLSKITLPKNFSISVFAVVPGARSMSIAPDGSLLVSDDKAGVIYRIAYKTAGKKQ